MGRRGWKCPAVRGLERGQMRRKREFRLASQVLLLLKAEERQVESLGADLSPKGGDYLGKRLAPLKAMAPKARSGIPGNVGPQGQNGFRSNTEIPCALLSVVFQS